MVSQTLDTILKLETKVNTLEFEINYLKTTSVDINTLNILFNDIYQRIDSQTLQINTLTTILREVLGNDYYDTVRNDRHNCFSEYYNQDYMSGIVDLTNNFKLLIE